MEVNKTDPKAIEPIKEENEDENATGSPEKKEAPPSPSKPANPAKKTEGSPGNAIANSLAALKKKGGNAGSPSKPSPPRRGSVMNSNKMSGANKMMRALTTTM